MTIEQKDKKLFHIIHEAERDFPFQTSEFYSLEHDSTKVKVVSWTFSSTNIYY